MRRSIGFAAFALLSGAAMSGAYEYPLQFTPNPGGRGVVVVGHEMDSTGVLGDCSYYTVAAAASGRGGGGGLAFRAMHRRFDQTCRWDLYGNLLSVTPGLAPRRGALYTNGTQFVFATGINGGYTGTDTKLPNGGFVNTPGSHYTWVTSNAYQVLPQAVTSFSLTLKSDGDFPLNVTGAPSLTSLVSKVAVTNNTCTGAIAVGSTCSITVSYDPTGLNTPSGLAYDTLTVGIVSDAGQASEFIQSYTLQVAVSVDD